MTFFLLSLGRSRSLWLSLYFTDEGSVCYHEPYHRFGAGLVREFKKNDGITRGGSGSDLVLIYPALKRAMPESTFIKIVRPYEEVKASYRRMFPEFDEAFLDEANTRFTAIPEPEIRFNDLDAELPSIERQLGITLPDYKRELMLNTRATMKELRY